MNKARLIKEAKSVLDKNWNGIFTKPAPGLYPHQWNWDAGFIAIGQAHFNWERAVLDLTNLFSGQWKNGMLPHIIFGNDPASRYFPGPDFWQSERSNQAPGLPTSGIIQPPVHGFALWKMYQLAEDKSRAREVLQTFYPKTLKLHEYLYLHRDPKQEGLVYITHPWAPGTDNSPTWDSILARMDTSALDIPNYTRKDLQNPKAAEHRPTQEDYDRYVYLVDLFRKKNYDEELIRVDCPFLVQDPLFNAILIRSNECLIEIGQILDEDTSWLKSRNKQSIEQMNRKLWNAETAMYDAFDLVNDQRIVVQTSSGLIPLFAGIPDPDQANKMRHIFNSPMFGGKDEKQFWSCPTYNLQAPNIQFQKYWRGPVWINMNWMLYQGFRRYGFTEEAQKIKKDSLALVAQYGFFEYFDPRKQITEEAGYGTNQFSWTAALTLDFLLEE